MFIVDVLIKGRTLYEFVDYVNSHMKTGVTNVYIQGYVGVCTYTWTENYKGKVPSINETKDRVPSYN